ncbi:hypothetical protein LguiB_013193 [Lonicera macranthoides]
MLGSPMKMDAATTNLIRPSVARVFVEMNILKKFHKHVWLGSGSSGFWQFVEYKNIPKFCTKCMRQGHDAIECKIMANKGFGDVVPGFQAPAMQGNLMIGDRKEQVVGAKEEERVYQQIKHFDEHIGTSTGKICVGSGLANHDLEDKWQEIRGGEKVWIGEASNVDVEDVLGRDESAGVQVEELSIMY